MSDPMPFLFQRHTGAVPRVISPATVLVMLRRRCAELAEQHPSFRATSFTPHDFRRLLATDLVNNGLPIHIGAALLGHLNLQTTRGYVAVFNEDVVRHYQEFLDRRRQARSADEYKPVTNSEQRRLVSVTECFSWRVSGRVGELSLLSPRSTGRKRRTRAYCAWKPAAQVRLSAPVGGTERCSYGTAGDKGVGRVSPPWLPTGRGGGLLLPHRLAGLC
jgi:hypothetical protein